MEIPKTFIKNNKKYFFVEQCKNFIRYQTANGICECFDFYDLGLIQETIKPHRKQYKDGIMFFKNII